MGKDGQYKTWEDAEDELDSRRKDKRIAELEAELAEATKWNHAVSVCKVHTDEIVSFDGCVICEGLKMIERIAALESALREIAEHPHCSYYANGYCHDADADTVFEKAHYEMGCTDGHRCAAEIARKALEGKA